MTQPSDPFADDLPAELHAAFRRLHPSLAVPSALDQAILANARRQFLWRRRTRWATAGLGAAARVLLAFTLYLASSGQPQVAAAPTMADVYRNYLAMRAAGTVDQDALNALAQRAVKLDKKAGEI